MEQLKKRYGNTEVIASNFCKKALNHKPVTKPNDIDEFGIFLTECYYAIQSIEAMKILEYPDNIRRLVQKLPFYLHDRWRSLVEQKREKNAPINFALLVEFVTREARKLADPTYGKDALSQPATTTNTNSNTGSNNKPKTTLTTQVNKNEDTSETVKETKCCNCKGNHSVEFCPDFKKKEHYEKLEVLKKNGYCFGCLRKGHLRSECESKHQCTKCEFKHLTVLHIEPHEYRNLMKPRETLPVKAHALTRAGEYSKYNCTMAIVPVKVKRRNGLKVITTYAFFDNGSSVTFCTERLMNKLGIQGRRTRITLQTMTDNKTITSYQVDDLEVFSYDLKDSIIIPRCYSKEKIPVDVGHIPTKEDVMQWPHLNKLIIPEIDFECGIDMMIGNNIPDAYTPYQIATGPRGSPHATKTALGWIFWNVLRETTNRYNVVNRIEIQQITEHEKLNEMDKLLHQQILNDFPERTIDDKSELSYQDKLFYEKVENSLKYVNGRYEIALPFKDNNIVLPDNKEMVLRRLYSLERKLKGNNHFKSDYTEFMNSMITNGYAEEVPLNEIDRQYDKTWFIPHHGVYHKQKKKIRAVFDCSARCRGVSLNDVLLPGPDLANNLLGVLMRFRIYRYPMTSDLQSMFHMIKCPTEDRDSFGGLMEI